MKRTNLMIASVAILTLVFTGCKNKKNESPSPAFTGKSSTTAEFSAKYGAKKQTYTINLDNSVAVINGQKGTTITIPQNSFKTQSGEAVTGQISVELIEIFEKGDMVLSNRPTTSNGELLVSGGEIYIGVTANGEQLFLNDSSSILIELPADSIQNDMTLFTGSTDSSQFNWTVIPNVVNSQNTVLNDTTWYRDTVPYFYYDPSHYIFTVTNLGWINCDRFYNVPQKTNVEINCSGDFDVNQTRAYLVFKSINSVASLSVNYFTKKITGYNVPVGESVTVLVFSFKDGKEFVGIHDFTVTDNFSGHVDLQEASEENIAALIKLKCN